MALSRPVKFPLLKLPWLCIKCVLHNADEFVIIYFATISDRTRRIVKNSNCPIDRPPLNVHGNKLSDIFGLGISTVKELIIGNVGTVNMIDLKYLLETLKVTDEYEFFAPIPANFSCDPQIFNCRKLSFNNHSARWVTLEILCQFDVPQLSFSYQQFSVKEIVSYVTYWFNSKNRKLEYLHIEFNNPISLEDFKIDHLNPMPFCEKRRNRWTLNRSWEKTDMSSGKDILRKDGLLATFFVKHTSVIFYVWHSRFPDAVQQ